MIGTNGNVSSASLPFDEEMCERYIFGELNEAEQELFETAYFDDDAFFNRFLAIKDELLDLRSRNELDSEKKRRLERHFAQTEPRRERLEESDEFVRAITLIANDSAPMQAAVPERPAEVPTVFETLRGFFTWPRLAAVAGLSVLVVIGALFVGSPERNNRADGPVESQTGASNGTEPKQEVVSGENTPAEGPGPATPNGADGTNRKEPRHGELAENPQLDGPAPETNLNATPGAIDAPPAPDSTIAQNPIPIEPKPDVPKPDSQPEFTGSRTEAVTLSSTTRSVTAGNTAIIGTATESVSIRMLFGGESFSSYSVRITTLGGGTVWRASNLKAGAGSGAKAISVSAPASSLTRKDYIVVLEGRSADGSSETIREYYLHIERR